MRWTPGPRSGNLEDRRGQRAGGRGLMVGGGLGLGGVLLVALLSMVTGQNFFAILGGDGGPALEQPAPSGPPPDTTPEEERMVDFVNFVLVDNQETWHQLLGDRYQDARLVLFRDAVDSACGFAQAATGPFYCPADGKVYIDLGFYQMLHDRFGAPGDFAQAYVIAHEIGHHVQNLLGTSSEVRQAQQADPRAANQLSVLLELQADCLAGVWGHSTRQRQILEQGDVEEGLNAAAAIGDDRMQEMSTGRVTPDSFTHGSSEQRVAWFRRGLSTGDPNACDTFSAGR